ncbi:MAG: DNA sulfur modification protein DndB [Bacillota bacterium]|jgi:DNA sulfur modification protein DndB
MNVAVYRFPAIKGVQAGTEYYISMVPLSTLPRLFMFNEEELPPEVRAQRILNKARIPEIRDYILQNPKSYVFSALTVSVDGEIQFEAMEPTNKECKIGIINIPMSARFLINDGQHRKAAIEAAIKHNPLLKHEDISVVFFSDMGLNRSRQIFSDLNRYAIRPTKSLNILFDSRNDFSAMICEMVESLRVFNGWVEKERSTIPNRSKALFTLSGIYHGTEALLNDLSDLTIEQQKDTTYRFWSGVFDNMPDWQSVILQGKKASELRKESVSAHSIALIALGRVGNILLKKYNSFEKHLPRLTKVNWSKNNPEWAGKVVVEGHISGTRSSTNALVEVLKETLMVGR